MRSPRRPTLSAAYDNLFGGFDGRGKRGPILSWIGFAPLLFRSLVKVVESAAWLLLRRRRAAFV